MVRAMRLGDDELAADELERLALENPEVYEPVTLSSRPEAINVRGVRPPEYSRRHGRSQ